MKKTITINEKNRTIELESKKFATAASRYGTTEYSELQAARRDYPNFKVVVKSTSKSNSSFKGLTYEFMERYIKLRGNEEIQKEFENQKEIGKCYKSATAYNEMKKWFLEKYPEVNNFGRSTTL